MARLRQFFSSRYSSADATSAEFENIVRYLNSAEYGNKTLAELLAQVFDTDTGDVNLGLEIRLDTTEGLQFRLDDDDEWQDIATLAQIRGPAGADLGAVESPIMYNRQDYTATVGQSVFSYPFVDTNAEALVFVNGVLQSLTDYVVSVVGQAVTFGTPLGGGEIVTIYQVRSNAAGQYQRADVIALAAQVIFPYVHTATDEIVVYKNGLLQRAGGGYDYIASPATSTITMTTPCLAGDKLTFLKVTNRALDTILGLMTESKFCTSNGFIDFAKVAVANDAIAQAKVNGLVAALASKGNLHVGTSAPPAPAIGNMWINTALTTAQLFFWDGARWLSTSPQGLLPLPTAANALQVVRVNSLGAAYELAAIDFSGLIPTSAAGAAAGVATLDGAAKLAASQVPAIAALSAISGTIQGSITNATFQIGLLSGYTFQSSSIALSLAAGSCTAQLVINGANVGGTLAVTTTPQRLTWAPVSHNASASPLGVALVITAASGASALSYSLPLLATS